MARSSQYIKKKKKKNTIFAKWVLLIKEISHYSLHVVHWYRILKIHFSEPLNEIHKDYKYFIIIHVPTTLCNFSPFIFRRTS